jgi:hypothetical protein
MTRTSYALGVPFLLAMSAALAVGSPMSALSPDDELAASPPASPGPSHLLEALAFTPPEIDVVEFTDWTALKALHGGSNTTSASPLEDRQRVVLDMVRTEARRIQFGLARLATWPALWGWDNTDLAWEATWSFGPGPRIWVLRFRDGWDPEPFVDRLEGYGYSRREKRNGTVFGDAPDFDPDPDAEAILDPDERLAPWPVSVAISHDRRTVVIGQEGSVHRILKAGARADPAAVAARPTGRVAAALGRLVAAYIVDGDFACSEVGLGNVDPEWDAKLYGSRVTRPESVGPLHPYQAFGVGYDRAEPNGPAVGRYAFAYKRAKQGRADLAGRRTLIEERYAALSGRPTEDVAVSLGESSPDRRTLTLEVDLRDDAPQLLFDLLRRPYLSPVACG